MYEVDLNALVICVGYTNFNMKLILSKIHSFAINFIHSMYHTKCKAFPFISKYKQPCKL